MAEKPKASLADLRAQLEKAHHNLSIALRRDDQARQDTWRVWSAKVELEYGRIAPADSGLTPREYYQSAYDDAEIVIRHAPADIEEALAVFYYAKDELQALDNSEGRSK